MICVAENAGKNSAAGSLIAGRLRTVCVKRTLPSRGATSSELRSARAAAAQGLDSPERTMNFVVDRLLKELTW